jgi:hypothetical protein
MILSASELKRQLMDSDIEKEKRNFVPLDWESKKSSYAEVGGYFKRMVGTSGWKVAETWLLNQLDVTRLIHGDNRDRIRAEAYADFLSYINNSIKLADKAVAELEDKKE